MCAFARAYACACSGAEAVAGASASAYACACVQIPIIYSHNLIHHTYKTRIYERCQIYSLNVNDNFI